MMPAFHIKRNIDFNKNFGQLLEVIKFVAVSEYHNIEGTLRSFERLQDVVADFLADFDVRAVAHPFLDAGGKPPAILAVTSDMGLLGGLNNQIISKAVELVMLNQGRLVIVGERGQSYAQEAGIPSTCFPGISDDRRYEQACEIRDYVIHRILSGELGGLKVVYPRALSFVVHRIEVASLIPFRTDELEKEAQASSVQPVDAIYESSHAELIEYLLYLMVGQRLFEIFGMSRLTEQAARFTHLEESCQKIKEMNQKLTLQYFRRRHEVIDANMRELFAARSLYAK